MHVLSLSLPLIVLVSDENREGRQLTINAEQPSPPHGEDDNLLISDDSILCDDGAFDDNNCD